MLCKNEMENNNFFLSRCYHLSWRKYHTKEAREMLELIIVNSFESNHNNAKNEKKFSGFFIIIFWNNNKKKHTRCNIYNEKFTAEFLYF